ncbi:MAG: hypothetical protein JNK04_07850 [Myxococcales bacterium]|nr:hypothetical protein [Myxococcales bacterium]
MSSQGGGGSPPVPVGGQGGFPTLGGNGGEGGGDGGEGGAYVCPSPTTGVALALTDLSFGEGNNGQWKAIGFNIDGLVSDSASTDVCQPNAGGNPDIPYPDGNNGIDNSFGKNLVPLILGLVPEWPTTVNTYIDEGLFNTMLKIYCLPPTGDASGLTMKVFNGTNLGSVPNYDGTDEWPVAPEILSDLSDPESSTLVFDNSSVSEQLFDSGDPSTIVLTIPIEFQKGTTFLKLTLYHARITMTLSDDRKSATGGIIGGVLNTEEVVDQLDKVAFAADICDQANYMAAVNFVRQSSDIMADGSQDPSSTCDGISFGIAFEMNEIQIGPVGEASIPALSCQ